MKYLAMILLSLIGSYALAEKPDIAITPERFKNLGITLGNLESAGRIPLLYAPATVALPPANEYVVSVSQPGLITKMTAAPGDSVKKGSVLAQIDSPALLDLQTQFLKAANALKLAEVTYNRDKKLHKDGVIAHRREQETLSAYTTAQLEMHQARQMLEIAGMSNADINQLTRSHRLNSLLSVHAPISGVVLERLATPGTRIDSMSPLYRIGDLDELWLEIAIPQERIHDIQPGDQVVVDNTQITAVIKLLGQNVNPVNQAVMTRAVIKEHSAHLRVGQKVTIQIIQPGKKSSYKVPNTAIAQHEGKTYIFVHVPNGFRAAPVEISGKQGDETIINGDFSGDESIAVKGSVALKANWLGLGSDE